MTIDTMQTQAELKSSLKLARLAYAVLLLVATNALFYFFMLNYSTRLMTMNQFASARTIDEYLPLGRLSFFFMQLLVTLFFFRPIGTMFGSEPILRRSPSPFGKVCLGAAGGFVALLVATPALIGIFRTSGTAIFLADHLFALSGIGLALLLIVVLPFLQAAFFQGILLRQLLQSISLPFAYFVSTLVFMLCWPAFNMIAGAILGLATGIVFWRTRSILACAVTNSIFTIGAIGLQLWRLP